MYIHYNNMYTKTHEVSTCVVKMSLPSYETVIVHDEVCKVTAHDEVTLLLHGIFSCGNIITILKH